MLRHFARLVLLLVLLGSLLGTGLTVAHIAADPMIAPLTAAASDQIVAATDRMLAQTATPQAVADRITARLNESPRNWLALDALLALAQERAIALPPDLLVQFTALREEDHGYIATASSCAVCAYDPTQCSLTEVMICQAPIALTPIGDIAGITRAGVAYASGEEVDQIDLALSVVGLGATAAVLASGGSSSVVKAGASIAKLARKMGRLSPRLVEMATDTVRTGVDWAKLPAARSMDDLRGALHSDAFVPLTNTLTDLDRVYAATDATTALHLLPLVDDAADARKLAAATEALGAKTVGRAEMLGKTRLFRATLRLSKTAWKLLSGMVCVLLSVAMLISHMVQHSILRALRRAARKSAIRI